MEPEDINNRFVYHSPNPEQTMRHEQIRAAVTRLAHAINDLCPESREKSLAITNLEQAQFWANASVARNDG